MDFCFTGRRDRSRQTTEKVILYKLPAGPFTECTFGVSPRAYFLSRQDDVIASFSFGAWSVQKCFCKVKIFEDNSRTFINIAFPS